MKHQLIDERHHVRGIYAVQDRRTPQLDYGDGNRGLISPGGRKKKTNPRPSAPAAGGGATRDRVERAAWFEVLASDVFGSGYRFDGQKNGVIWADSHWQVESDGVVAGSSVVDERSSRAG